MAVRIFKDGESILVEPKSLQAHLQTGWSVENPDRPTPELKIVAPQFHVGRIEIEAGQDEQQAALAAMGIHSGPMVGAMNVPV